MKIVNQKVSGPKTLMFNGTGAKGEVTTAIIKGSTVTVEGTLEFNDTDFYPGHQNVSAIKVTATGDNELIPYNVVWNGINSLNTTLNYTVYKTSTNLDVKVTCNKLEGYTNGNKVLYEECSINNSDTLGTPVAEGVIEPSTESNKITLVEDEFITAVASGDVKYYYVVIEYPNLDEPQNIDMGGTFNGKLTVVESDVEPDINIVAVYLQDENNEEEYNKTNDIPQSGYKLNITKSTCTNGATVRWDYDNKELITSNLTKSGTSCYLYFDELKPFTINEVIASKNIGTRTDFTTVYTADTTGTVFTAEDDDGTSYYYVGAPTDNYVEFANKYWRIIRVNGDGSIRMIYSGDITTINTLSNKTTVLANGYNDSTTKYTQIEECAFNSLTDNNMYVGFMYTSDQGHGLGTSSTIKGKLDAWYNANLAAYADDIDINAGFCGDRTPSSKEGSINNTGGTGKNVTYYAGYVRLYYQLSNQKQTSASPTFKCANSSDLYTVGTSSKGNKALTNPIGLISAEEVAYAGGVYDTNNIDYYLYTGNPYWTLSPFQYSGAARVFFVHSSGYFPYSHVGSAYGVRPVINLKADTLFKDGSLGTIEKPYEVLMET